MTTSVLYFSVVNIGNLQFSNGGNMCCRNHIRRLAEDDGINLYVVIAGLPSDKQGVCEFLETLKIPYRFLEIAEAELAQGWLAKLIDWFAEQGRYLFEKSATNNPSIESQLSELIKIWQISNLVVDYLPSTLFCRNLFQQYPSTLITLNREGEFYLDLRTRGVIKKNLLSGPISQYRWNRYEKWAYRKAQRVVAIGPPDLPNIVGLKSEPKCVTPYLPQKCPGWRMTSSKTVFFVGNIQHYPNRLAMEWISTQLAPQLMHKGFEGQLVIVGASKKEVPFEWHNDITEFAGFSTASHVDKLFREAALCLCPIENDYGMKFKAAEALAYGTPLLASKQTLLGFPYMRNQPYILLDDAKRAAQTVKELIQNRLKLQKLHRSQQEMHNHFVATQQNIWSQSIFTA